MTGQPPSRPRRFPLSLDQVAAKPSAATAGATAAGVRTVLMPQAPLQHAERERQRHAVPQGVGLDSVQVRRRMIERLRADGIGHVGVLDRSEEHV